MEDKYRYGGMSVAFGSPKMNYLEGRCVGGASEINAGLYNEPSAEIIDGWAEDFYIEDLSAKLLLPYLKENEKLLGVVKARQGLGPQSRILQTGAHQLDWKGLEVPRMWKYDSNPDGKRCSMSLSAIPRAVQAGCRLMSSVLVDRIFHEQGKAHYAVTRDKA